MYLLALKLSKYLVLHSEQHVSISFTCQVMTTGSLLNLKRQKSRQEEMSVLDLYFFV